MKITRRSFLCKSAVSSAVLGLTRDALSAAKPDFRPLADFIRSEIDSGSIPGAYLAISKNSGIVFEDAQGTFCGHMKPEESLGYDVISPLYSFSKLVSATVIAMLHQDGLLSYDEPVSEYISAFKGGGKDSITIRHLLTHSAGVPSVPLGPVGNAEQWEKAVEAMCAANVVWEPGSRSTYHALTSSFTAAAAACRVTGKPWTYLVRTRLAEPIGAPGLSFEIPQPPTRLALTPIPADDVYPLMKAEQGALYKVSLIGHPAGGCFGTPRDMVKLLNLHVNGGRHQGQTLIKKDVFREMHRVQYHEEIAEAVGAGRQPDYQTWGLGPLMRGTTPPDGAHAWFGFGDQDSPGIFGHAGISTVIGLGDPATKIAIAFITTDAPKPASKPVVIRSGVTNSVFDILG